MLIGQKIRNLRKERRLSLVALSKQSGVQLATLSRIENLKMIGTLQSHIQIAKALGINLTQLYGDISTEEEKVETHTPSSAAADVFIHSEKSTYEILTGKVLSKKMMPTLLKIEPKGQTNPEQNSLGSEKFIYILEGDIEVKIGKEAYPLSKNNTLYFDASLKHFFINKGALTAKILCVLTPVSL